MWLKATFASALTLASFIGTTAQAAYVVTLEQEGPNVVATGSGTLDLAGLTQGHTTIVAAELEPAIATISTGPATSTTVDFYHSIAITGPTNFGSGSFLLASSGSGDSVFFSDSSGDLLVPVGYVSGSALSDSATYDNQTLASLDATPGSYKWTWGSGANQNFTLDVNAVPEPSTWAMIMLGFAGLGFAGFRSAGVFC